MPVETNALRLIAITDNLRDGVSGLVARALAVANGGATMLHLRLPDETPRTLVQVTKTLVARLPIPVLVHDRADVALAGGAAGVHLSPVELPAAAVRRVVPAGFLVGVSVGDATDVRQVAGADYVGIGPVFSARAGEGQALGAARFGELAAACRCPAVAIGGISPATAAEAIAAGAVGVAVLSAIFAAADPERATRAIRDAIGT